MVCKMYFIRRLSLLIFLSYLIFIIAGCQKKPEHGALEGAWKMASGTYIGPSFKVECSEQDRLCYKVISKDHFAVVEVCPANPDSMLFTAVGIYSLSDSVYTEKYEATNVSYKIGTSMNFKYKLEENQMLWIIDAKEEDMELHEVWQRIQ